MNCCCTSRDDDTSGPGDNTAAGVDGVGDGVPVGEGVGVVLPEMPEMVTLPVGVTVIDGVLLLVAEPMREGVPLTVPDIELVGDEDGLAPTDSVAVGVDALDGVMLLVGVNVGVPLPDKELVHEGVILPVGVPDSLFVPDGETVGVPDRLAPRDSDAVGVPLDEGVMVVEALVKLDRLAEGEEEEVASEGDAAVETDVERDAEMLGDTV